MSRAKIGSATPFLLHRCLPVLCSRHQLHHHTGVFKSTSDAGQVRDEDCSEDCDGNTLGNLSRQKSISDKLEAQLPSLRYSAKMPAVACLPSTVPLGFSDVGGQPDVSTQLILAQQLVATLMLTETLKARTLPYRSRRTHQLLTDSHQLSPSHWRRPASSGRLESTVKVPP